MDTATIVFLVIGGIGVALMAAGLLGGELLHFGHPDVDGPVSLEMIAGFVGAFGFGAAIANELLGGDTPGLIAGAAGAGLVAAVPTAWLAVRLARAARDMRTDATPTRDDLVGSLGIVVTPIPAGGYGEVRVQLGGQQVKFSARAAAAIPLGVSVFVVEAPTDTSVFVEETQVIQ